MARIVISHYHTDHIGASRDLAALTGAEVLMSPTDATQARHWHDPERGRLDAAPPRGARLSGGGARLGVLGLAGAGRERASGGADAADRRRRRAGRRRRGVARDPGSRPRGRPDRAARHAHRAGCWRPTRSSTGSRRSWACIRCRGPTRSATSWRRWSASAASTSRSPTRGTSTPSPTSPAEPPRSASITRNGSARTAPCWPTGRPTPYAVSLRIYGDRLGPNSRRIAVVESLAHLVHLERRGEIERHVGRGGRVVFSAR